MRSGEDELVRWRDASMDPSALTTRAADLLNAGREVPPLPDAVLARIEGNIVGRRPLRPRGVPLGLRVAMLTAILLASVATAKGTMLLWRRYVAAPPPGPAAAPAATASVRSHAARGARVEEAAPVVEPIFEPIVQPIVEDSAVDEAVSPEAVIAPAPTASASRARRRGAIVGAHVPHPAPIAGPAATSEAELLAGALSRLRQARDPRGALALLDEYARTFPRGLLASEALSARLEAVLELDDRSGALALLDGRRGFAGRLGAEQLLTRAELRANAGRYADALGDFDALLGPLAGVLTPPGLERAHYGRAVSLGHLGRDDRARVELLAYQKAFPTGKHAAEVARLLKSASPGAPP